MTVLQTCEQGTGQAERWRARVPAEWAARGFSGEFSRRAVVEPDLVERLYLMVPCLAPRDQAWLLLELEHEGDDIDAGWSLVMVRNDAAARVDVSAIERGHPTSPTSWPGGWA